MSRPGIACVALGVVLVAVFVFALAGAAAERVHYK